MTRALGVILHNWPLKLAAIGLATLLYGGLVLSQNTQTLDGPIPVEVINQPDDVVLLSNVPPLTEVRYFSPTGAPAITTSFQAEIDLASIAAVSGPVTVPVQVRSVDPRIQVLGYEPTAVTIDLEPLRSRSVPVVVDPGAPPANLELGEATTEPAEVEISGPASVVDRVTEARADVTIQPSGVDVDQEVPLRAVDALGNVVGPVDITPLTVRVIIPVFSDRQTRTLPVNPVITGTPAPGFQITSVTVDPPAVTVEGDADELAELIRVDTAAIPVTGASSTFERETPLALPGGVAALGDATVLVTIELRPVTETRAFNAGVRLVGADPSVTYTPAVDRILVTIAGGPADLDRLTGSGLVADLDVSGLGPGTAEVAPKLALPAGLTLVGLSPETVEVTVTAAAASVEPAPGGSPEATASEVPSPSPVP